MAGVPGKGRGLVASPETTRSNGAFQRLPGHNRRHPHSLTPLVQGCDIRLPTQLVEGALLAQYFTPALACFAQPQQTAVGASAGPVRHLRGPPVLRALRPAHAGDGHTRQLLREYVLGICIGNMYWEYVLGICIGHMYRAYVSGICILCN